MSLTDDLEGVEHPSEASERLIKLLPAVEIESLKKQIKEFSVEKSKAYEALFCTSTEAPRIRGAANVAVGLRTRLWVDTLPLYSRAFIAMNLKGENECIPLNFSILFDLPCSLLINWDGFELVFRFYNTHTLWNALEERPEGATIMNPQFINLISQPENIDKLSDVAFELGSTFVADSSKSIEDKFFVLNTPIFKDPEYNRFQNYIRQEELLLAQIKQKYNYVNLPNEWVREMFSHQTLELKA